MAVIEMELSKIIIRETSDHQYIFLKEKNGERTFPIVIGFFEAAEINRQIKEMETPRPMTHELLSTTIRSLGARVAKVIVNELKNNTFFAKIVIQRNGETIEVDSRPSDAIALASREKCPIFVDESVINSANQGPV